MKFLVLGAAVAAASGSSSVAKRVSNSVVMVGGLLGLSTVVEYVSSVGTVPVLASGLGAKVE
jgi:phosphosulfolactate phosphohydrolase-like enzyme